MSAQHTTATRTARPLPAAAAELLEAAYKALPFVEDAETDAGYKPGYAKRVAAELRAAIAKADPAGAA